MVLLFLLVLSIVVPLSYSSCSVENPSLISTDYFFEDFSSPDEVLNSIEVIIPSKFISSDDSLRIVGLDNFGFGDEVSSSWFSNLQRLGDGFIVEFTFQVTTSENNPHPESASEGLAFVLQKERIVNIDGGLGQNFGFKGGFDTYLAVVMDFCGNRASQNTPGFQCGQHSVQRVIRKNGGTVNTNVQPTTFNIGDGTFNTVKVLYRADVGRFDVSLNGNLVLTFDEVMTDLFDSRFAYLGFSSANSGPNPANFDIHSFKLETHISDSKIHETYPKETSPNKRVSFNTTIRDPCDLPVEYSLLPSLGINISSSFTGTLSLNTDTETGNSNVPPVVLNVEQVIDNKDGSFRVVFLIPNDVVGSWDLDLYVNGVQTQSMPQANAVVSSITSENFLTPQTIGILVSVLLLILLLMLLVIKNLDYYRRKLKEHKEDIDAGHEVIKMEELEKDMVFEPNRLVKTSVQDIEKAIADNIIELQRLRLRNETQTDNRLLIRELEMENEELRNKLKDLKRKGEMEDAFDNDNELENMNRNQPNRKEFVPEFNEEEG